MKEDFSIFKNSFFYLEPESAELFEKYLMTCRRGEHLATELNIPTEALKQQVHRMKRGVVEQTSGVLNRKYQFMGGMQKGGYYVCKRKRKVLEEYFKSFG